MTAVERSAFGVERGETFPPAAKGADTIFGNQDDDISLAGGRDADKVYGGSGDDVLAGGDGADKLYGEDGEDYHDCGSDVPGEVDVADGGRGLLDTALLFGIIFTTFTCETTFNIEGTVP